MKSPTDPITFVSPITSGTYGTSPRRSPNPVAFGRRKQTNYRGATMAQTRRWYSKGYLRDVAWWCLGNASWVEGRGDVTYNLPLYLPTLTCIYLYISAIYMIYMIHMIFIYYLPSKLPSSVGKWIYIDHRLSTWELVMGGLLGGSSQDL